MKRFAKLVAFALSPAPIVEKIAADVARVSQSPEIRERLTAMGAEAMSMSAAELQKFVRNEISESAKVIKARWSSEHQPSATRWPHSSPPSRGSR